MPVSEVKAVKALGEDDLLIYWKKPIRSKLSSYSQEDWEGLPETLRLRQIKVTVKQPGFRVTSFYIVTTLLDAEEYSASVQALRQWEPHLNHGKMNRDDRIRLLRFLTNSIAGNIAPNRPGRSEPRAVKRRPKNYQRLNRPRHAMKEIKHRSKYRAEKA